LPFLVLLSRETRRVINQNFLLGLGFVLGGMVLGGMNILSPVAAAMFHVSGSLLVVFNSFRLMRQGEELQPHEPAGFPSLAGAGVGS
jgi:Cd2+/Zn2+-exporting ATPase